MEALIENFKLDWETAFPGIPTPELQCFDDSARTLEYDIQESQKRIENLKFELSKEEFILDRLKMLENDKSSHSKDNEIQIITDNLNISSSSSIMNNECNINNNDLSSDDIVIIENSNEEVCLRDSINNEERSSSQEFVTIVNPSADDVSNQETIEVTINPNVIRSVSNTSNNSLSTFCFGSAKSSSGKCSTSSSQSSLNELFTSETPDANESKKFERFSNIKTYNKSYSEQEDEVFDFSGHSVARRLTDPFPLSPKEPKDKPKSAPRTLSRKKPLPPLPKKPLPKIMKKKKSLDLSQSAKLLHDNESLPQLPEDISKEISQEHSQERTISQTSSAFEDDEHIYTDINELNIRGRLPTPEVEESYSNIESSDDEQIYENSNMQPKIQPLVDNSDSAFEDKPRQQRLKRLGSHDRQAVVLPDDIEINSENDTIHFVNPALEAILNGSKESLVDDIDDMPDKPNIVIGNHYDDDDDDDDDDEHIYANVDDLILGDDDGSCDSISMGLPSPHYKELTSAQIESMLEKIQNNASDHSHGKLGVILLLLNGNARKFYLYFPVFKLLEQQQIPNFPSSFTSRQFLQKFFKNTL